MERERQQSGGTSIENLNGDMTDSSVAGHDIIHEQHQHFYARRSPQTPLANELFKAYHFDLVEQIDACLDQWEEREQGIYGFAIAYNSTGFLKNFCERLRYHLGRNSVFPVNDVFPIDPMLLPVRDAVSEVKSRLTKLTEKHLIIALKVDDSETAQQFWTLLRRECRGRFPRRLLVVLGLPAQSDPAMLEGDALVPLLPPHFRKLHISKWIGPVVDGLNWPNQVQCIDTWKEAMFCECVENGRLHIEKVYRHINFITELLQEHPSPESFLRDVQERCACYAQTTD